MLSRPFGQGVFSFDVVSDMIWSCFAVFYVVPCQAGFLVPFFSFDPGPLDEGCALAKGAPKDVHLVLHLPAEGSRTG